MSCVSGSVCYFNRTNAKRACKNIKSLGKGNLLKQCKTLLRPYKCNNCGMWHLTSMQKLPGRNDTREN